jgi:hypothetical protein
MAFGNEIKTGNITENWLFELSYNSGTLRLSFQDYNDGSNFYYGSVLNKPSMRESINLENSTANTSNISLQIPDFTYEGNPISELLFGGSNYFINKKVVVKSVINNATPVIIGNFRLINISTDGNKINLSLTSHRPWDFISFPQNKHPDYNVYEPVVYGDFSPATNANTSSRATASRNVYPVPVLYNSSTKIYTVMPRSYSSSDNAFIHYYAGFNQFVPLRLAPAVFTSTSNRVDSTTSTTIDNSGLNILGSRIMQNIGGTKYGCAFEGYVTTAPSDREVTGGLQFFDNQQNMFKWKVDGSIDTTTSANALYNNSSGETFYALVSTPKKNFHIEYIDGVLLGVALVASDGTLNNDQNFTIDFFSNQFDSTLDELLNPDVQRAYNAVYSSGTGAYSTGTGILTFNEPAENSIASLDGCMCPDELLFKCSSISSGIREDNTFKLISMQLHYIASIPTFDGDGGSLSATELSLEKDIEKLNEIEYFYCGGNGLQHGITGLSGDITEIHEAHLDLLNRFAGLDVATNPNTNIDGWSDLDSAKNWKIRYWKLEPTELKNELEKLQYEGGFIFRYKKGDIDNPQYIFIKDSYTSTDYTLTKNDINDVTVSPNGFNSLLTQMNVNYQRHPSESKYYFSQESSNGTSRTNYNIQTKENIKEVELDAYVSPEIPSSPSSNPNDDFYTYYDNIFGDIKIQISGNIVNPKFYNIDVGDTVDFTDMYPEKAFGKSFNNVVFMITSLQRTAGILKFEAREIGAI